jgi:intracellular sulfur oxidation DsrE/DsrF family protein
MVSVRSFRIVHITSLRPPNSPMTLPARSSSPSAALARRSFLSRVGAGLAAFSGAFALAADRAGAQQRSTDPWKPTRHPQDDWLDQVPGQHRMFFDATSANGTGEAMAFASNFYYASKSGYELGNADSAVVICLRHYATAFAFGDAIWAKYGAILAERIKFTDPKTNVAPVINVFQTTGYGVLLTNRETTLSAMVERGTHFAICDMATRAFAGLAAGKMNLKADEVYKEFRDSAIPNAHFMAAGIVAVNRAQERGYTIQYIG